MTDPVEPMPRRHPNPPPAEMRMQRRAILARNLFVALAALLLVVTLGVVTYSVVVTRQAQVTNADRATQREATLRQVKVLANEIRSCTTPGKPCAERGRKQTAKAVAVIGASNRAAAAAAAACAARMDTPTYKRVLACVNKALADSHDHRH